MKSPIFTSGAHEIIQDKVLKLLNQHADFLSEDTAEARVRLATPFNPLLRTISRKYLASMAVSIPPSFARRRWRIWRLKTSLAITTSWTLKLTVKILRFNMPNLTSVDRLARFYEDDANFFVMLMVKYCVIGTQVKVSKVHFIPIEYLKWSCLTTRALGVGQIQIANSKHIEIDSAKTRRSWMLESCENNALEFYPRAISKITKRISKFEKAKEF